jgi:hypothetical protein
MMRGKFGQCCGDNQSRFVSSRFHQVSVGIVFPCDDCISHMQYTTLGDEIPRRTKYGMVRVDMLLW